MELITCKNCNYETLKGAYYCPKCGHVFRVDAPQYAPTRSYINRQRIYLAVPILLILFFIYSVFFRPVKHEITSYMQSKISSALVDRGYSYTSLSFDDSQPVKASPSISVSFSFFDEEKDIRYGVAIFDSTSSLSSFTVFR